MSRFYPRFLAVPNNENQIFFVGRPSFSSPASFPTLPMFRELQMQSQTKIQVAAGRPASHDRGGKTCGELRLRANAMIPTIPLSRCPAVPPGRVVQNPPISRIPCGNLAAAPACIAASCLICRPLGIVTCLPFVPRTGAFLIARGGRGLMTEVLHLQVARVLIVLPILLLLKRKSLGEIHGEKGLGQLNPADRVVSTWPLSARGGLRGLTGGTLRATSVLLASSRHEKSDCAAERSRCSACCQVERPVGRRRDSLG